MTFDSKLTSEKHLCLVSRAAYHRIWILRKFWRVFHDRSLLERCFRGFLLPVLEYCSAVWCSVADTHLKLLDPGVSGAQFLTGGVFECDIAHCRSVAILCMLYKIRCSPMHKLNNELPGPYVPVWVTHSAMVAHRYTYAPPRCSTSQYRRTFVSLSLSLWNDLANPVFTSQYLSGKICLTPYSMVWDWRVSRAGPMPFYWPSCSLLFCLQLFSSSLHFLYRLAVWGWGLRTDRVSISLSRPCIANIF